MVLLGWAEMGLEKAGDNCRMVVEAGVVLVAKRDVWDRGKSLMLFFYRVRALAQP